MKYIAQTFFLSLAVGLFIGCGGPPAENPMLIEARAEYEAASADPSVVTNAPLALEEAKEALDVSERKFRNEEDQEEVTHYAYVAKQRVKIARQAAKLNAAEEQVKRAESERQEVLIEARAAEAERARREAEEQRREAQVALAEAEAARREAAQERQEAEAARAAAAAALARAEELARQVEELQAQQTERGLVLTLGDVLFDVDKATLKPGGMRAVEKLVTFLNEYPKRNVMIEGFTDSTGGEDYNLALSELRADAVKAALVNQGIAATRIRTKGYGEGFPVASNANPAGRQLNRRVEVIISDDKGIIPARTE